MEGRLIGRPHIVIIGEGLLTGGLDFMSFFVSLSGSERYASFPESKIWLSSVPSKVAFFVWVVVETKSLTLDNLQRRGFTMPNWCVMCKESESVDHLLLHCKVAQFL